MKKTLMASAIALALVPTAFAQSAVPSGVTLYGIVDAGVVHVTGMRGGSQTFLASGIMEGSRFGLRGSEDLGGGYRAIFTLENRFEADTGGFGSRPLSGVQAPDRLSSAAALGLPASLQSVVTATTNSIATAGFGVNLNNSLFDRQLFVGLVTPFGAVLAGRQYTPAYEIVAAFDAMKTESSLSAGQVASIPASVDIRLSNTLAYRVQANQFSGVLMYGAGEVAGSSSNGRFLGVSGQYKTDAFSAGLGYNTRNNELGQKSLTNAIAGASLNVGPGAVTALLASVKNDNPSGLSTLAASVAPALVAGGLPTATAAALATSVQNAYTAALRQDGRLINVGYRFKPHAAGTLTVAYTRYNDRTAANADTSSYGAAYSYALSKRTDFNIVLTHFDNRGQGQALPGQNGFLGGVTETAGTDSNSFAIGLRHRF
jgi:predicted porin